LQGDLGCGKADFGGAERLNQATERLALKIGRAQRRRGELATDDKHVLQHIDHTLHLERRDEIGPDLRIVEQFLVDPLDRPAHGFDVGRRF
jgi:hypothetical protein